MAGKKYCPNCQTTDTERVPCPECDGSGERTRDPDAAKPSCPACDGGGSVFTNVIRQGVMGAFHTIIFEYQCPTCKTLVESFLPKEELEEMI